MFVFVHKWLILQRKLKTAFFLSSRSDEMNRWFKFDRLGTKIGKIFSLEEETLKKGRALFSHRVKRNHLLPKLFIALVDTECIQGVFKLAKVHITYGIYIRKKNGPFYLRISPCVYLVPSQSWQMMEPTRAEED
jgi:hypothetical protein